jgi:hypothetical protein
MFLGHSVILWALLAIISVVAITGDRQFRREEQVKGINKMSFHEVFLKLLSSPARGYHPEIRNALLKRGGDTACIYSPVYSVRKIYAWGKKYNLQSVIDNIETKVPMFLETD